MKTETTGVKGARPAIGALPSNDVVVRLGFDRAAESLSAPQPPPYSARQKVSERQADVACSQQERAMEMGFLAAAAGLDEDRTQVLFMTLQLYWQRNGPSMCEACYEAGCMWARSHGLPPRARSPLSYRQVAARFKRLDQVMLRSMRA